VHGTARFVIRERGSSREAVAREGAVTEAAFGLKLVVAIETRDRGTSLKCILAALPTWKAANPIMNYPRQVNSATKRSGDITILPRIDRCDGNRAYFALNVKSSFVGAPAATVTFEVCVPSSSCQAVTV
jgi:hypothetical protein